MQRHRSRDEKRRYTKNISKRGLGLSLVVERVEERELLVIV
jgi:hypothetical protein